MYHKQIDFFAGRGFFIGVHEFKIPWRMCLYKVKYSLNSSVCSLDGLLKKRAHSS